MLELYIRDTGEGGQRGASTPPALCLGSRERKNAPLNAIESFSDIDMI